MSADQMSKLLQRCRAVIAEVIAAGHRADHHDLISKGVRDFGHSPDTARFILIKQIFDRSLCESRIAQCQAPINVESAFTINGKDTAQSMRVGECDAAIDEIDRCMIQIEFQLVRGESNAELPQPLISKRYFETRSRNALVVNGRI